MAKTKKEEVTESTSTAIAVITPEEQAYLDSLGSGRPDAPSDVGPNKLVINTKAYDDEGNPKQIGVWRLEGVNEYGTNTVVFRPIRYANKLVRYTQDPAGGWTFVGETQYFTDFLGEILDSTGGLALGRKFGRKFSKEEKDATKKLAETYMDIFGLVTFEGGEPQPCLFRTRGGKMNKMLDAFNSIPKDKRYSQFNYTLTSYQDYEEVKDPKTGKTRREYNDYWSIKVEPDMSKVLPVTTILKFDAEIVEFIRENNHKVLDLHRKNRQTLAQQTATPVIENNMKVINGLDDEIPF